LNFCTMKIHIQAAQNKQRGHIASLTCLPQSLASQSYFRSENVGFVYCSRSVSRHHGVVVIKWEHDEIILYTHLLLSLSLSLSHTHKQLNTHTYKCVHTLAHVHINTHTCTNECMHKHTTHTYVHTHTHSYTHTTITNSLSHTHL